jgi:ribosome-associated translation inhibitor RaiA
MQVQINTDHNIEGSAALTARVRGVVESALSRVCNHITRVEVHLTDEDGDKSGKSDMRCVMEARLEGRQPVAVIDQAGTLEQAVDGAADKLARLIGSTLGRLHEQASRRTDPLPHELPLTDQS